MVHGEVVKAYYACEMPRGVTGGADVTQVVLGHQALDVVVEHLLSGLRGKDN